VGGAAVQNPDVSDGGTSCRVSPAGLGVCFLNPTTASSVAASSGMAVGRVDADKPRASLRPSRQADGGFGRRCEAPALLEGKVESRAPGFLIQLWPAADVASVASDLAIRYGFQLRPVFSVGSTIVTAGPMTPQAVAALRCDSAVRTVSHDAVLEHVI
jgi:hypothetical protein